MDQSNLPLSKDYLNAFDDAGWARAYRLVLEEINSVLIRINNQFSRFKTNLQELQEPLRPIYNPYSNAVMMEVKFYSERLQLLRNELRNYLITAISAFQKPSDPPVLIVSECHASRHERISRYFQDLYDSCLSGQTINDVIKLIDVLLADVQEWLEKYIARDAKLKKATPSK